LDLRYQSKPDNLKAVAQELGVSTVLEGDYAKFRSRSNDAVIRVYD
jgi:TolB-like protein